MVIHGHTFRAVKQSELEIDILVGFVLLCAGDPLLTETMFQDPSGCLTLWIVLNPKYAISYAHTPMIKFNL